MRKPIEQLTSKKPLEYCYKDGDLEEILELDTPGLGNVAIQSYDPSHPMPLARLDSIYKVSEL